MKMSTHVCIYSLACWVPWGQRKGADLQSYLLITFIKSLILLQKQKYGFQNKFHKRLSSLLHRIQEVYSTKKALKPGFNRSVTGVLVCVSDCWFLRSYFASSRSLFTRAESDWPDKFSAHRAESGLPEEGGDELVVLYEVDLGLLDGPSSTVQGGSLFLLHRMFALFRAEKNRICQTELLSRAKGRVCIDHKLKGNPWGCESFPPIRLREQRSAVTSVWTICLSGRRLKFEEFKCARNSVLLRGKGLKNKKWKRIFLT